MFTAVLNEAVPGGPGCIKDETLMSSLKLQVDPLVSAFNIILTGPTTETNGTHSEAFLPYYLLNFELLTRKYPLDSRAGIR